MLFREGCAFLGRDIFEKAIDFGGYVFGGGGTDVEALPIERC